MGTQEKDLSSNILKEMRELRDENAGLHDRLFRIEAALHRVLSHVNTLTSGGSSEANCDSIDQFITEQIEQNLAEKESLENTFPQEAVPETPEDRNWEFFVAQKGGFDEVLYMTVQDFLGFEDVSPAQLVSFLTQKRDREVNESFLHLRTEYENLDGNQLQSHFTQLWKLHHNLLKKKIIRTWKEEIFLEAFNKFINWLQQ